MPIIVSKEPDKISSDVIGLIIPPPELRNIVDKTACFVARNGKQFEKKIHEKELNNKKFNFLKPEDPYHKYYLKKVKDFIEAKSSATFEEIVQKQQELLKKFTVEQFKPDKPPKEFEFIVDPPSISPLDLNVVRLTAQFVARNGRQFLTNLMNREQRNPEFDFLRPQHVLFPYFAKLLEQYTKILIPPKDLLGNLREELAENGIENVLNSAKYRANYIKYEEKQQQLENEKIEKERMAYNSIDWHDFFVVEQIEYFPGEIGDFPKPLTPETLGNRLIKEQRDEDDETFDVEMQLEKDEESDTQNESSSADSPDPVKKAEESAINISDFSTENVTIKKYDPKKSIQKPFVASQKEEYLISPLTGEKILASKLSEHMRIGLLDPRWIEQRDKLLEKSKEQSVFSSGDTVIDNLKQLAERRTDIFGEGDKETEIGKKIGEEGRKENQVIWDGRLSSVESTTRAMNKNIAPNHVQEIPCREFKMPFAPPPPRHPNNSMIRFHSCMPVPPPLLMLRPSYPMRPAPFIPLPPIPIPMNVMREPPMHSPEVDPPAKKLCPETKLIPEDEFMQSFMSPIYVKVQLPTVEKSEWNLNGQVLSIDIDLSETVLALKQKIQEKTEMPPTKQKISYNGMFLKDNFSVAYYNVLTGSTINLQIRERGGRKK